MLGPGAGERATRVGVFLFNDPMNSRGRVAAVLREVFPAWSDETANAVMLEAHRRGRARCGEPFADAADAARAVEALRSRDVLAEVEAVNESEEPQLLPVWESE